MTRLLFFLGCLLWLQPVLSQSFQNFGNPTGQELNMTSCPFEKEADAVMLVKDGRSDHNERRNLLTDYHYRIKILKETGKRFADVSIAQWDKDDLQFIENVEAMVINVDPNGSVTRTYVEPKSIYRKRITADLTQVTFSFPNVKVGSILEYKFRSTMKHYGMLEPWEFQEDIPVMRSHYRIAVLPDTEFSYLVNKSLNQEYQTGVEKKEGAVWFEMKNVPAMPDEPFMDAKKDYLQNVSFQLYAYEGSRYMASWQDVIRQLSTDTYFGSQLNKKLSGSDPVVAEARAKADKLKAIETIYDYVRKEISWNGTVDMYSESIKDAWSKRNGTRADINLILVNLLQSAKLDAYPVLVAERKTGKVNETIPFVDQFNTVMAAVNVDGKWYYFDASNRFAPAFIVPSTILNTTALIVNRKAGLVKIADNERQFKEIVSVELELDNSQIKGSAVITSSDYARQARVQNYKKDDNTIIEKYVRQTMNDAVISGLEVKNVDNDTVSLIQKFEFQAASTSTGDYLFVPFNICTGFSSNPFTSAKRLSDINFGYRQQIGANIHFKVPKGYKLDVLPKAVKLSNPDKTLSFTREFFTDQNTGELVGRLRIEISKSQFLVEEYPGIQEFYKKMFEFLNEQLVLKKTATP